MANYYIQATIEPIELDKALFTQDDLEILEDIGIEWSGHRDTYTFFVTEAMYICEDEGRSYTTVFQHAIERSDGAIEEIVIHGACTYSRMIPGEFGGFCVRITKDKVQTGRTSDVLELLRNGRWPID